MPAVNYRIPQLFFGGEARNLPGVADLTRPNHSSPAFMPFPTRKAILWDNDGVLVDSERLFYQANRDFFREYGIELTPRQFFDWYLQDDCGAWHLLGVSGPQVDHLRAQRNVIYNRLLREADDLLVPGMDGLLTGLTPHLRMGIVTSSRREDFLTIHTRLPLLRHFEFALTGEDYTHSKPSPEPYLLGLERLGLGAEDCLVIEDSPRGLQAAKAAGIDCIVVRTALTEGYEFPGASAIVNSTAELADAIQTLVSAVA